MSNLNKHKILESLYLHWEKGEEETGHGKTTTPLGLSMSIIQLQNSTNINSQEVKRVCDYLCSNNYVSLQKEDVDGKSHFYLIESLGRSVYIDKMFRNKYWLFNFGFWKWFLIFSLALYGALNSTFHFIG